MDKQERQLRKDVASEWAIGQPLDFPPKRSETPFKSTPRKRKLTKRQKRNA
jgi:hypothetical protein